MNGEAMMMTDLAGLYYQQGEIGHRVIASPVMSPAAAELCSAI